jgi:ribonuclease HII
VQQRAEAAGAIASSRPPAGTEPIADRPAPPTPCSHGVAPPVPAEGPPPGLVSCDVAGARAEDLYGFERSLRRHGFPLVAGADEAGRGACAGPLVVAACVLPDGRRGRIPGLADSKLLTPQTREAVYAEVVERAIAVHVVEVTSADVDRLGLHVCNIAAMRRAVAGLHPRPAYALLDGFPVRGLGLPSLAVWKGDRVAACVAAASVLAKVTRDRIMVELDRGWPGYGFAAHKGYVTAEHQAALAERGPCPQHRFSYLNVRAVVGDTGPMAVSA